MLTRQLGKILRGNATPFQLVAACVLGALLGFAPGISQAPALYALLVAALLTVNANLGLALLVMGLARLLSFVIVPVSFRVGQFLLDGPTSGIAHAVVNAPILAWCGLEHYAVAGGQLIGLVVGTLVGLGLSATVRGFRRRMIAARDNPSRIKELAARPWARALTWLLFGGAGKQTWEQKLAKRVGNPVRIWGAALILVALVGVYLAQQALAGPIARHGLRVGLEEVNGATVDVGAVELDLGDGRFAVSRLALADPNALERDLLRAERLEADVDQADFLRRRVHVARVVVSEARSGAAREEAGERTARKSAEVYEETREKLPDLEDLKDLTLEDVIVEYEVWKERLAQARRWLERLSGDGAEGEDAETLAERLEREVRERGWLNVEAEHLVDDAPTFRLSELVVDGLDTSYLPGRVFDLRGSELSTHPALVDAPPRLALASRDGEIGLEVDLAPVSRAGGDGALRFHWKGFEIDTAMSKLKLGGAPPFRGGTLDLELDGAWDAGRIGWIDLPLKVTLRRTTFSMPGVDPTPIEELVLPIGLSGPIDAPRIRFDSSVLSDALLAAGKRELANRVQQQLEGRLGDELDELKEKAGVELPGGLQEKLPDLPDPKGALEGLFGGKKEKKDGG